METFAANLRRRAAELNVSHAEIARRAGLNERRYAHYVSGNRQPDLATLVRITEALETTPDVILGVSSQKPETKRTQLLDRLSISARTLSDLELELVVIQIEALAFR